LGASEVNTREAKKGFPASGLWSSEMISLSVGGVSAINKAAAANARETFLLPRCIYTISWGINPFPFLRRLLNRDFRSKVDQLRLLFASGPAWCKSGIFSGEREK